MLVIKYLLRRAVSYLKESLKFFLPVYALKEESVHASGSLNVIFAGYLKQRRAYYGHIVFEGKPFQCVFLGIAGFWGLSKFRKKNFIPDIIIAETNPITTKYFLKQPGYVLPQWVNMKVDLTHPIKEMRDRGNGFDDTERKIRKHHWEYEVTEDPERLKEFYFKMYLPYIKKHGERAFIASYPLIQKLCASNSLLLVKKEGVPCAGVVLYYDGASYVLMNCLGVADGNMEYVKQGVVGALYYYTILESQHRGYRELNLGGGRPFLNDGLTRYKLGFKGEFYTNVDKNTQFIWMSWRSESERAIKFLKENPVICLGTDWKLKIACSQ